MWRALIDLLACPACRGTLRLEDETGEGPEVSGGRLICREGNHTYTIQRGMPRMMPPPEAMEGELWSEWGEKQEGLSQRRNPPDPETKAYFEGVAAEFSAFCHPEGLILDVGCGTDSRPAYAIFSAGSTYIGIDPIVGKEERKFDFVQGIGEALPIRPAVFDWVLSATSLDHFPEPCRVLAEVKRVLKPTGRLGLWVGVADPDYLGRMYPLPSLRSSETRILLWGMICQRNLRRLAKSACQHLLINRVQSLRLKWKHWTDESKLMNSIFAERSVEHFRFYKEDEVLRLLWESGYQILKRKLIADFEHGNSLFVVAAPSQV